MGFILRGVKTDDLNYLVGLAKQFSLINLPPNKNILAKKIETSIESFKGTIPKSESEYIFVLEDLDNQHIAGTSSCIAKHGTEDQPHCYFQVIKQNHFSEDLGLGFIHKVLRIGFNTDGPTEIGGLLVDIAYRRRPEKVGRQISFVRFNYMAMYPERFEKEVLCEFAPPLTDEGRSEFWEAFGRRFTGLPYQEADLLSHEHKEFIHNLFPKGDIYLCLLESTARLVVGRVGEETKPAQHLLEKIGFKYTEQVDPFDGGPHYSAMLQDISLVKNSRFYKVSSSDQKTAYSYNGFISLAKNGQYIAQFTAYEIIGDEIFLPLFTQKNCSIEKGENVFVTPLKIGK